MKAQQKFDKVMHEFSQGTLKSHDETVNDKKRALAIAFSEARKIDPKFSEGGDTKIIKLNISQENPLSKQLSNLTGDPWSIQDFESVDGSQLTTTKPFRHIKTGQVFEVMAKGGSTNNLAYIYAKGTAKQLWEAWDERQRKHFISDHMDLFIELMGPNTISDTIKATSKYVSMQYNELPDAIKKEVVIHHAMGMYKDGGSMATGGEVKWKGKWKSLEMQKQAFELLKNGDWPFIGPPVFDKTVDYVGIYFDRLESIALHGKSSGGSMAKGGQVKSNALQNLKDVLDGIAIDMEGEDETSLASFRFELDDAKTSKDAEKLIADYENDWLDDISDKRTKAEIKNAIASYRSSIKSTGGTITPAKRKLQDRIDTLKKSMVSANSVAQRSIQKRIDKLQAQLDYKPTAKQLVQDNKGRFAMDVPAKYSKAIYKKLWSMNIMPRIHKLGSTASIVVNSRINLNKAYKVYSDISLEKVPALAKISRKL